MLVDDRVAAPERVEGVAAEPTVDQQQANAATAGGNATRPRIAMTTTFQVKIGSRHIVMPGARIRNIVVRTFTPHQRCEIATSASPRIHRSAPTPGEHRASDSGGYAVPALSRHRPPTAANARQQHQQAAAAKNQYDIAFSRGNAMSGAPICSGTR